MTNAAQPKWIAILSAHQRAAAFSGIFPQADSYDLKTFRMLVAAQSIGEETAHAVGDRLRIGRVSEFEDGVDALAEFRIGQADDDAGTHLWMRHHRGLDLGRVDIGA